MTDDIFANVAKVAADALNLANAAARVAPGAHNLYVYAHGEWSIGNAPHADQSLLVTIPLRAQFQNEDDLAQTIYLAIEALASVDTVTTAVEEQD